MYTTMRVLCILYVRLAVPTLACCILHAVPCSEFRAWHGGQVEAIVNFGTALMLDIREVYSIYM